MKKTLSLFVILLSLAYYGQAQEYIVWNNPQETQPRYWSQGALTWDDFKGLKPLNQSGSWLEQVFEIQEDFEDETSGLHYCRPKLTTWVDQHRSWVTDDYKTTRELYYNQVLLNLAEMECRSIQSILNQTNKRFTDQELLVMVYKQFEYDKDEFNQSSNDGYDSIAVAYWLDSTNNMLRHFPDRYRTICEDHKDYYGIDAWIGAGSGWFGESLRTTFAPSLNFCFGTELTKSNNAYMMDIDFGFGNSLKPFVLDNRSFNPGTIYSKTQISGCYGYYLTRKSNWGVMPFAGLTLGFLSASPVDTDEDTYSDVCGSWIAGITIERTVSRDLFCPDSQGYRQLEACTVGGRVFVANANYSGEKSISINAGIVVKFTDRNVKVTSKRRRR